MTFGSLFAGIGGIDVGLERAGMVVRWQVEIDPFCNRVLAKHWPAVVRHRDVREVGGHNLEPVDLIAGGFPCQGVSVAGKGAGLDDERSGLWFEYLRVVQELRPRWVLVENVPALRTRGCDTVTDGLAAAGYACWPLVVGARHVGAPHRRDRVWIIGRLDDTDARRRRRHEPVGADAAVADREGGGWQDEGDGRIGGSGTGRDGAQGPVGLAHGHGHGREGERRGGLLDGERPAQRHDADGRYRWPARPGERQHEWEEPRTVEPPLGGAVDGLSQRLAGRHRRAALKALGNSVVPQVVEAIGRAILEQS